jgi:CRISPR-associated protein Cas1
LATNCSAKNFKQAAVLKSVTGCEVGNMMRWAKDVRSGDPDNLEGRAAVYYWRNLFPDIPNFTREREGM